MGIITSLRFQLIMKKNKFKLLNIKCYKNDTLKEAMNVVKDICTPGDVVLLSPACASWDQYDRFEDRGDEFKKLVRER